MVRARPTPLEWKNEYLGVALREGGNCSLDNSWIHRQGVSQAQKAKETGDERPRLRASSRVPPTFHSLFFEGKEKKVGNKRYEARSRERSSPDTLAF